MSTFRFTQVNPPGMAATRPDGRAQKKRPNNVQHWKFKPVQNPAEMSIPYPPEFNRSRRHSAPTIHNLVSHWKVDSKTKNSEKPASPLSHTPPTPQPNSSQVQIQLQLQVQMPTSAPHAPSSMRNGYLHYKLPKDQMPPPLSPPSINSSVSGSSPSSSTPPSPPLPPTPSSNAGSFSSAAATPPTSQLQLPANFPSAAFLRRYSAPYVRLAPMDPHIDEDQPPAKRAASNFNRELAPIKEDLGANVPKLPPLNDLLDSLRNNLKIQTPSSPQSTMPPPPSPTRDSSPSSPPASALLTYEFPPRPHKHQQHVTFSDTTTSMDTDMFQRTDGNVMSIDSLLGSSSINYKKHRSQSVPHVWIPQGPAFEHRKMSIPSIVQNL
jgi:hypothetical protein